MIYNYSISTAANTAETSKQETVLKVSRGVLHKLEITFPGGCAGLLNVQIFDDTHQIFPTNPGGSFALDNVHLNFAEFYEITSPSPQLKVITWNDDDTYEHKVHIAIGILPKNRILRRLF